jgi:osmoprotectant transport system permease protein
MDFLGDVAAWLFDGDNWQGRSGVPHRMLEHVHYTLAAVLCAMVVAGPVAVWLGHKRRFGTAAMTIANIGQTLPSFAILVLAVQVVGSGTRPIVGPLGLWLAMSLLAIPPIFTNAYTGVAQVEDAIRDAARGMGMSTRQQILRAELPAAAPVVLTGVRIAAVQVVATATIGAYASTGGLGRYIIDGFALQDYPQVFSGALVVAVLAIVVDRVLAAVQRRTIPDRPRAQKRQRSSGSPRTSSTPPKEYS